MKAGSGENWSSGKSRLANSKVVGSTEASANRRSTALAARWTPVTGNPKISSSAAPESADAPARLKLKATPMLIGLDTALPSRSRWNSHPAALTPATHSPARASGSAGCRATVGANTAETAGSGMVVAVAGTSKVLVGLVALVVSEESQASAIVPSTTSRPISFAILV